jgi:hypothetical protein
MSRFLIALYAFSLLFLYPATGIAATEDIDTLFRIGQEIHSSLAFDHLLGVAVRLLLLFIGLKIFELLVQKLRLWRFPAGETVFRWLPTIRLLVAGLMLIVVVNALTPEHPSARAAVVLTLVLLVLYSSQTVLKNAAAGAVLIARHAVNLGDYLQVGPHAGCVTSITLRGVEIESEDGSRTFVPGMLFHTAATTVAPGLGRAVPITVEWAMKPLTTVLDAEEVRTLARRMALVSPRRAPETPVLVSLDHTAWRIRLTITPFDQSESEALRTELVRRLSEMFEAQAAIAPS